MSAAVHTLQTQRLILRPFQNDDLAPFAALNSDPEVMEFLGGPMSKGASDAMAYRVQELFAIQGWGFWATELKDSGDFIGFIGLNRPPYETHFTPCVEVGWRLARPYWGQGYATEGARSSLDFAFSSLELPEVVSFTTQRNRRSMAVMERLGMVRDARGDFEHPLVPDGSPLRPHVLYRLTGERWRTLSQKL